LSADSRKRPPSPGCPLTRRKPPKICARPVGRGVVDKPTDVGVQAFTGEVGLVRGDGDGAGFGPRRGGVAPGRSWSLTKMKWSFGPFVPVDQVAT